MLLVLARGLFVACALSGFGAALFARMPMKPIAQRLDAGTLGLIEPRLRVVTVSSLGVALLIGVVWLLLQTHAIAGTSGLAQTLAGMPEILLGTRFGQVLALQAVAMAAALAAAIGRRPNILAAGLAGIAVLLEAGHSHAFAMADGRLLLSQTLHLLAAGAWLGGLAPLLIVVRAAPLATAASAARRFSALGSIAVGLIAATALFQGTLLSGGLSGLTGTAYGAVLLMKTALFAALILLAAVNRHRFVPALAARGGERARRALLLSIAFETAIGLSVVLAASLLGSLEPGMHMQMTRT